MLPLTLSQAADSAELEGCESLQDVGVLKAFLDKFEDTLGKEQGRLGLSANDVLAGKVTEVHGEGPRAHMIAYIIAKGEKAWWFAENPARFQLKAKLAGSLNNPKSVAELNTLMGERLYAGDGTLYAIDPSTGDYRLFSKSIVNPYRDWLEEMQKADPKMAGEFQEDFGAELLTWLKAKKVDYGQFRHHKLAAASILGEKLYLLIPADGEGEVLFFKDNHLPRQNHVKLVFKLEPKELDPKLANPDFRQYVVPGAGPGLWGTHEMRLLMPDGREVIVQSSEPNAIYPISVGIQIDNDLNDAKTKLREKDYEQSVEEGLYAEFADNYLKIFVQKYLPFLSFWADPAGALQILGGGESAKNPARRFILFSFDGRPLYATHDDKGRATIEPFPFKFSELETGQIYAGARYQKDRFAHYFGKKVILSDGRLLNLSLRPSFKGGFILGLQSFYTVTEPAGAMQEAVGRLRNQIDEQ